MSDKHLWQTCVMNTCDKHLPHRMDTHTCRNIIIDWLTLWQPFAAVVSGYLCGRSRFPVRIILFPNMLPLYNCLYLLKMFSSQLKNARPHLVRIREALKNDMQKHMEFSICWLTQNFAKQPSIFLFPKFLESFFTPKNTPPKVKNSKLDKRCIFLGTPCRLQPAYMVISRRCPS